MLAYLLSLLIVLLSARFLWRRLRYDLHKIPSPPGLPLLGHTVEFIYGQPGKQLTRWLSHTFARFGYPKLIRVELIGKPWLFITDSTFIKSTMLSKTNTFPKWPVDDMQLTLLAVKKATGCLMDESLPTPYAKAVRKIYSTAFQSSNLKLAMPRMKSVIDKMLSIVETGRVNGPIDVQELFVKMTLDVIGAVALGSSLGGLDGSRPLHSLIIDAGLLGRERLYDPLKKIRCSLFPNSKEALKDAAVVDALSDEFDKLVSELYAREPSSADMESIWLKFRTLIDPRTGDIITREKFRLEISVAIIAGMDTTGHQLAWILALLATHPHIAAKVLNELSECGLCGKEMRAIEFDDFADLPYLSAVIREGMRLSHVIVMCFPRLVPEDMSIMGYRVPKGTIIVCPGDQGFSTKADWEDPNVFRPERWLSGEDMSSKYSMPFLVGPKDCPGQRLAILEMRLAVAEILRRYQVRMEGTYEDLKSTATDGLVIEAAEGIWIDFMPRTSFGEN